MTVVGRSYGFWRFFSRREMRGCGGEILNGAPAFNAFFFSTVSVSRFEIRPQSSGTEPFAEL